MTLIDLQGHSPVATLLEGDFSTLVKQLTRFQLILRVARFLCDSRACCWTVAEPTTC